MSNDIQKADQIAYHIFTKLALVINQARSTVESKTQAKVDKWFNLETPDSDIFRDHLRIYRSVSATPTPPPLELQVLLAVPELTTNQVLVYHAPDSSRVRIEPTPKYILLETWLLVFSPQQQRYSGDSDSSSSSGEVAPSTIYKHGIPLFRSLFSLLRVLPAWNLFKRLRRRTGGGNRNANLNIQLRVRGIDDASDGILGFDTPPAINSLPLSNDTHVFPAVPHPMGTLSLTTRYLTTPNFHLDELESLLSSRFLSLDVGPDFTPTLAKNQQRDSISGSPGSLPIRTSLPKSPPSAVAVAERFVSPGPMQNRTTSLPQTSHSPKNNSPLAISRVPTAGPAVPAGSGSGISVGSSRQDTSSAWSKDDGRNPSGIAARLRKESTGAGRGADLPSSPGPLPIRRPNINPVHPFKASTLSSGSPSLHSPSPSLRQPSPLSSAGGPSLPSRPFPTTSPTSSRVPPSPIGAGSRPSPPFAPSSLGDRRSLASADGEGDPSPKMPARKRWSSSFSHRYNKSGGAGSEGSAGSGERERKESERVGSGSFLSNNTDDDDISMFVQDIDARKPLSGHQRLRSHDRDATETGRRPDRDDNRPIAGLLSTDEEPSASGSGSTSGPMLTSELEVDEKLRQMNQTFLESLEGLGGSGRRRERRSPRLDVDDQGSERSSEGLIGRESSGQASRDSGGSGRGRGGFGVPRRPYLDSRNTSTSDVGGVQGSDEVLGRMSFDEDRRRSRGQ